MVRNHRFRPVVFIWLALMLLQSVKDTFAVFPCSSLPNISNIFSCLVRRAEQKIYSALFKVISLSARIQLCARNLIRHAGPVYLSSEKPASQYK